MKKEILKKEEKILYSIVYCELYGIKNKYENKTL